MKTREDARMLSVVTNFSVSPP